MNFTCYRQLDSDLKQLIKNIEIKETVTSENNYALVQRAMFFVQSPPERIIRAGHTEAKGVQLLSRYGIAYYFSACHF
jgi:hypothetical protein